MGQAELPLLLIPQKWLRAPADAAGYPAFLDRLLDAVRCLTGNQEAGARKLGRDAIGPADPDSTDRMLERRLLSGLLPKQLRRLAERLGAAEAVRCEDADGHCVEDLSAFLAQRGGSWLDLQQEVLATLSPYAPYNGRSLDGWLLRPAPDWQADGDGILTLGIAPRYFPDAAAGFQDASLLIWQGLAFERGRIAAAIWMPLLAEGGAAGLVLSFGPREGAYVGILGSSARGDPTTLRILRIDGGQLLPLAGPLAIPATDDAAALALSFERSGRRLELRLGDASLSSDAAAGPGGHAGLIRFDSIMARFSEIRLDAR